MRSALVISWISLSLLDLSAAVLSGVDETGKGGSSRTIRIDFPPCLIYTQCRVVVLSRTFSNVHMYIMPRETLFYSLDVTRYTDT